MNVYRTAGGTWVRNQAEWIAATKDEGGDYKVLPVAIEVPTNPKEALVGFLNGLSVAMPSVQVVNVGPSVSQPDTEAAPTTTPQKPLDELFAEAPLRQRLDLAVTAIDASSEMLERMANALKQKG